MRLINLDFSHIGRFRFWPVFRAILAFAAASFRSRTALQLEILALRDQVCVLQRSVKRPKLTAAGRLEQHNQIQQMMPDNSYGREQMGAPRRGRIIGWHSAVSSLPFGPLPAV